MGDPVRDCCNLDFFWYSSGAFFWEHFRFLKANLMTPQVLNINMRSFLTEAITSQKHVDITGKSFFVFCSNFMASSEIYFYSLLITYFLSLINILKWHNSWYFLKTTWKYKKMIFPFSSKGVDTINQLLNFVKHGSRISYLREFYTLFSKDFAISE